MKQHIHSIYAAIAPVLILFLLAGCASTDALHFVKAKPKTSSELTNTGQHLKIINSLRANTKPIIAATPAIQSPPPTAINNTARKKHVHIQQYAKILSNIRHIAIVEATPDYPPNTEKNIWDIKHRSNAAQLFLVLSIASLIVALAIISLPTVPALSLYLFLLSPAFAIISYVYSGQILKKFHKDNIWDNQTLSANLTRIFAGTMIILYIILSILILTYALIILFALALFG